MFLFYFFPHNPPFFFILAFAFVIPYLLLHVFSSCRCKYTLSQTFSIFMSIRYFSVFFCPSTFPSFSLLLLLLIFLTCLWPLLSFKFFYFRSRLLYPLIVYWSCLCWLPFTPSVYTKKFLNLLLHSLLFLTSLYLLFLLPPASVCANSLFLTFVSSLVYGVTFSFYSTCFNFLSFLFSLVSSVASNPCLLF